MPELKVGDEFAGHRIEGVLGRGGMGVVYRVVDLRLNRPAALKVITPALSADDDFRRRFQRESQVAAAVRQHNVVTIFQAGEAEGLLFVTMELIHGSDLRGFISQRGRIDLPTASAITSQIAAALDAAHSASLVHRDVKPANVLIADSAPLHVYLTDFGLTKRTSSQSGITKTGLFVGTIDYAAPEQIKGWPVDARADVYALGCVLFEMVTGAPPFRRDNEYATMYAHTSEPPPPLSTIVPDVPPALNAVVSRALAKDPEERFPSAGDMARAVEAAVAGQPLMEPERTVATGAAAPGTAVPTTPLPISTPTAPQASPVHGYGMEPPPAPPPSYPTAALPPAPRRNPWPWIAALVAVLAIAGAAAAVVLTRDSGGSEKTASTPVAQTPVQQPANDTSGPTEADGVKEIVSIVHLSEAGLPLTQNHRYPEAISNRRLVLERIDALEVAPSLERSRTLLRRAMQASLDADFALQRCDGCDNAETRAGNLSATNLKERFTAEFNPIASQQGETPIDPHSF